MSTLAEIETAAAELSAEEIKVLVRRLRVLKTMRPFTGRDAARWWTEFKHLPAEAADAFASAVDKARSLASQAAPG